MVVRIIYCLLFWVGSLSLSLGQQPATWHITNNDGLPSNTVYKIVQDSKGYVWIGTANGLSRFDGKEFKQVNENQLSDNEILSLTLDQKDIPWTLNLAGQLSSLQNGILVPAPFINAGYSVKNVKISNDRIWVVYSTEQVNSKFSSFLHSSGEAFPSPSLLKGRHLLNNSSLIEFGKDRFVFFVRFDGNTPDDFSQIYQISSTTNTISAIPTSYQSNYNNIKRISYINLPDASSIPDDVIGKIINNIDRAINRLAQKHQIKDMVIEGAHFYLLTREGVYQYRHQLSETEKLQLIAHYLPDQDINVFFKDKDDNIWLGTNDDGIHIISPSKFINYDSKNSPLPVNSVYCMYYDTLGQRLLLGQNNSFLSVIKDQKVARSLELNNIGRIFSMTKSSNRRFWVGVDLGVSILDDDLQQEWAPFTGSYKDFLIDSRNNIWLGGSGVIKYTTLQDIDWLLHDKVSSTTLKAKFKLVGSHRTYALLEDFSKTVWVGTTHGLFRYVNDSLVLVAVDFNNDRPNITDLAQAVDSTIWISSYTSGVVGLKHDKPTHHFREAHKLASNTAKTIFPTNDDKLWVGTDNGINIIQFPSLTSKWINVNDGLASNEINDIYVAEKEAWVATSNGLTRIELENLNPKNPPTPVQITNVQIFDKDTSLHQRYQLKYNQNNLKIDFLGIKFRDKAALSYRYKMEGLDQDWISTSARFARYPLLNPGRYIFKVLAIDEDQQRSEVAASIEFIIATPWWRSYWFYGCVLLFTSGLVGGLFYLRLRFLKREQQYSNRLHHLKMDALKAQMNPHFIFNSLIAIQKYITTNEQEQANAYLSRFARLIRMIFNQSDKQAVTLTEELEFLNTYITLEKLRFRDKIDIQLIVAPELQVVAEDIFIPPLLIQPIIENAFKHGLMHKEKEGSLIIHLVQAQQYLICSIKDNGVGRAQVQQIAGTKIKKGRASGINTTESRLEIWNKNHTAQNIEIIDLVDEAGNPAGTEFILNIRIYQEDT